MASTFQTDGYRDGLAGSQATPPDPPVYRREYIRGFRAGATERFESVLAKVRKGHASAGELIETWRQAYGRIRALD